MYNKKVMEHFLSPHNYGRIKNPDGIGRVGNPVCGDVMKIYIKVGRNKKGEEIIEDIKFETFGCVAALATSSVTTDLAKGKTLAEAINIGKKEIVEALEELPPIKVHCSILASEALVEAVYNYFSKKGREIPRQLKEKHQAIFRKKGV